MVGCVLAWISCSIFCFFIIKSKGYPENTCWVHCALGFILGVIWLIVVLCKGECKENNYNQSRNMNQTQNQTRYFNNGERNISPIQYESFSAENTLLAIEKLAELKDKGILTDTEYQQKKNELLKKI